MQSGFANTLLPICPTSFWAMYIGTPLLSPTYRVEHG